MTTNVMQLYPNPGIEQPVGGLYLNERLHLHGSAGRPFIYANFVASLDGRIALTNKETGQSFVPASLTTASDWLLFQELQAQADCFITHGGYLRALAAGTLDNILQVGTGKDNAHLLQWRRENGLHQQPGVVIASASLEFPMPGEDILEDTQPVYIVTGEQADRSKVAAWQEKGIEVLFAGAGHQVEGRPLFEKLAQLGFRSIYLEAGPLMLATMLRDGVLSRLYLTMSHQLLGGDDFHTLLTGSGIGDGGRLRLRSLYFETLSERQNGQFFSCFETLSPD